jgi:hypothetical protein
VDPVTLSIAAAAVITGGLAFLGIRLSGRAGLRGLAHRLNATIVKRADSLTVIGELHATRGEAVVSIVELDALPNQETFVIEAAYVVGEGPTFSIQPLDARWDQWGEPSANFHRVIQLGATAGTRFDRDYTTLGRNTEVLRELIRPGIRTSLASRGMKFRRLVGDGRTIRMELSVKVSHLRVLERATEIVAEIATHGVSELRELASRLGASYVDAAGPYGERTIPGFEFVQRGEAIIVSFPSASLRIRSISSSLEVIPTDAIERIQQMLAPSTLKYDNGILEVGWPEVPATEELETRIRLLFDIIAPRVQIGAFR